ncbi:hypothetical protein DL764_005544 [Monosporascus ibericus]|uniref:SGNH hydrolase-type esterase domain-containing protein n=1 Tax=Monosporascus ibericus TaxID=155417 RepID=A0A4Q4T8Y4_9PEZI|nr:hypothetical protein DL764_005544 [Monosporascus ibericus]
MWNWNLAAVALGLHALVEGTILQNGQVRDTNFPNTKVDITDYDFETYPADAPELSYKGRWDSMKVSWWAAPGLVFGFTGDRVAITFGELTTNRTLIGYRIAGMDWIFTNVTAGATHLVVTPDTPGVHDGYPVNPLRFEFRVSNWGYGVQIDKVHVGKGERLVKIPNYSRSIEFIGDSLTAGMWQSYEALSSFAHGVGAGLGDTEYSVVAYPGICVADQPCWGNPRGQVHQWFYTSDTGGRASEIWGDEPEPWDFSKPDTEPDIVVINLGTNDANEANNVSSKAYVDGYKKLIQGVHGKYPKAQVIVMQLWIGFYRYGNTFVQEKAFDQELRDVVEYFNSPGYLSAPKIWDGVTETLATLNTPSEPFVHYFSTQGILQHNDIPPMSWHPTDTGALKVASHLTQFIKLTFGWELVATGPEIYHETLYWNDEPNY